MTSPASRQAGGLASDAHGASALLRAAPDTAQTLRAIRRQTRSATATGPPAVREGTYLYGLGNEVRQPGIQPERLI